MSLLKLEYSAEDRFSLLLVSVSPLAGGGVIGVELSIRDDARRYIASHKLSSRISLLEGDSVSPDVLTKVKSRIKPEHRVMVILDSDHSAGHVRRELEAYSALVTSGSCLLVEDAVMRQLVDVPGGDPSWILDSPGPAIEGFLETHPEFSRHAPAIQVEESPIRELGPTFWPDGWLWKD